MAEDSGNTEQLKEGGESLGFKTAREFEKERGGKLPERGEREKGDREILPREMGEEEEGGERLEVEDVMKMSGSALKKYAKERGLDFDGLNKEDMRYAVAEAEGLDLEDEEEEGEDDEDEEEGEDEGKGKNVYKKRLRELEEKYSQKFLELEEIKQKAVVIDLLEKDPERYFPKLAKKLGFDLSLLDDDRERGRGKGKERKSFEAPKAEKNESLDDYIARTMKQMSEYLEDMVESAFSRSRSKGRGREEEEDEFEERGKKRGKEEDEGERQVQNVINYLRANYKDWGLYVDDIVDYAKRHPEFVNNPARLYRGGKALAQARRLGSKEKRLEQRDGKTARTGERPTKFGKLSPRVPGKRMNFDQAWENAKRGK